MAREPEPGHGFWGSLDRPDRNALVQAGSWLSVAPGEVLLARADDSGDVAIVWSGLTKAVVRVVDGKQVVLAVRGAGDIVGELSHINRGGRSAAVVAVNRVQALLLRRCHFHQFLDHRAHAAETLRCVIVDRLCEADRDRLAAASMTVGQRLARFLLKIALRHGIPGPAGDLKIDHLSQEDLAACIGGATRTVAREMQAWRTRKIISTERRSVTVHQVPALMRIAGRHAPPP